MNLQKNGTKSRGVTSLFVAMFVFILMATLFTPQAFAAQAKVNTTTNYDNMPLNYVRITGLPLDEAKWEGSHDSHYKFVNNWDRIGSGETRALIWQGADSTFTWGKSNRTNKADANMSSKTFPTFSLRWSERAVLSDGTKADIVAKFTPLVWLGAKPGGKVNDLRMALLNGTSGTTYVCHPLRQGTDALGGAKLTSLCIRMRTEFHIYKHGTTTKIDTNKFPTVYIRFLDLDSIDFHINSSKSDAVRRAGTYSEGIAFYSGFKSPMRISPSSLLKTDDSVTISDASYQKVRGKAQDDGAKTGFTAACSTSGYVYYWYGSYQNSADDLKGGMGTTIDIAPTAVVNATTGTGGTISRPGNSRYPVNATYSYTYKPNKGYTVKSLTLNGKAISLNATQKANGGTYTFAKMTDTESAEPQYKLNVTFQGPTVSYAWVGDHPNKTVPASKEITPGNYNVDTTYKKGDKVRATNVVIGGKTYPSGTWTFNGWDKTGTIQVYANTTIKGTWTFTPDSKITTEVVNGTITPDVLGIPMGENRTINYSPTPGYELRMITIDGQALDNLDNYQSSYTFSNVVKDHHIKVIYEDPYVVQHRITTEVVNGRIDGTALVNEGDNKTINYGPNSGCTLKSVTVDDEPVSIEEFKDKYDFNNVTKDHHIKVVYEKEKFKITTEVVGGTIDPDVEKEYGDDAVINYSANEGHELKSIEVDGNPCDIEEFADNYSFSNIKANHHIKVVYEPLKFKVTTNAVNGTIDESKTDVPYGENVTINYIPNEGYHLDSITVDDKELEDIDNNKDSYTFNKIDKDHDIKVVYEKNKYKITTDIVNGEIDDDVEVGHGDDQIIQYTPDEGYHVASIEVDGNPVDVTTAPLEYEFKNVTSNHHIKVVCEKNKYKVTTEVVNGKIDPDIEVSYGDNVNIEYKPNKGYHFVSLTVDDEPIDFTEPDEEGQLPPEEWKSSYDFPNIDANHHVKVVYEINKYKITTEAVNGTIDPEVEKEYGSDQTINYKPNEGYHIKTIEVDGDKVPLSNNEDKYDFTNIDSDHHIKVTFEKNKYPITTEVVNGTIDPEKEVEWGDDATITYKPKTGYHLESITVDDENVPIDTNKDFYEFKSVKAPHHIKVVYEINKYKIKTDVVGGTIDESKNDVPYGSDETIHYKPQEGYHLVSVTVDGQSEPIDNFKSSYPFDDIRSDHEIKVVYEINKYKITTEIENGTIDPEVEKEYGTDQTINYKPNEGYHIVSIKVDDTTVPVKDNPESYDFKNIKDNHHVKVVCERNKYNIKTNVTHGRIDPDAEVLYGDNKTITYEPEEGYHLAKITVDGNDVNIDEHPLSYDFLNVNDNHDIDVVYEINKYPIDTEVVGGTIDPSTEVEWGKSTTVNYRPNDGYQLYSVEVDDRFVDDPDKYDFTKVKEPHKIKVVYEKIPELAVEKSADKTDYKKGETVVYTLNIKQTVADAEARDVIVTDKLPDGLTLVKGSLAENEGIIVTSEKDDGFEIKVDKITDEFTVTYKATVNENTDLSEFENIATAKAGNVPKPAEAKAKVYRPVVILDKSVNPDSCVYGDTVTYTVKVKQTQRNATVNNAVIVDPMVEGIEINRDSVEVTGDEASVEFKGHTEDATKDESPLDAEIEDPDNSAASAERLDMVVSVPKLKESVTIKFTAKITAKNGTVTNVASVNGDELNEPVTDNASVEVKDASLTLDKDASVATATTGDVVKYTITLNGINVRGLNIVDKLPANMEYVEGSASVECTCENGELHFAPIETLNNKMFITYKAKAIKAGDATNVVTAKYDNNTGDDLTAEATVKVSDPEKEIVDKTKNDQNNDTSGPVDKTGNNSRTNAQTGDYVAIIALVALVLSICGAVAVRRRRSHN